MMVGAGQPVVGSHEVIERSRTKSSSGISVRESNMGVLEGSESKSMLRRVEVVGWLIFLLLVSTRVLLVDPCMRAR